MNSNDFFKKQKPVLSPPIAPFLLNFLGQLRKTDFLKFLEKLHNKWKFKGEKSLYDGQTHIWFYTNRNATVKIVGKSLMKLNNTDTRTMANDNCLSICLILDFE